MTIYVFKKIAEINRYCVKMGITKDKEARVYWRKKIQRKDGMNLQNSFKKFPNW